MQTTTTVDWAEVEQLVHTLVLVNGYPRQLSVAQQAQEALDQIIPPVVSLSPSLFAPNVSTQQVVQATLAGPGTAIPGNIASVGPDAGIPSGLTGTTTPAGAPSPLSGQAATSTQQRQAIPPMPPDDNPPKSEDERPKRRW